MTQISFEKCKYTHKNMVKIYLPAILLVVIYLNYYLNVFYNEIVLDYFLPDSLLLLYDSIILSLNNYDVNYYCII